MHVISKENNIFYLLSCLDIEIQIPKSALGSWAQVATCNLGRGHLTGDILLVTVTSCHIGAMLADGVTSTFFFILIPKL